MLKNICSRHHGVPPPPNTTLQLHTNTTVHDCYVLKAQLFNKQKEETIDSNTLSYNKIYTHKLWVTFSFFPLINESDVIQKINQRIFQFYKYISISYYCSEFWITKNLKVIQWFLISWCEKFYTNRIWKLNIS